MKVLVDECAPRALRHFLLQCGQESITVQEVDWAGKENGELLALAETRFDVLVTIDSNLRYQPNLEGHRIGVIVIRCSSNRLEELRELFPACA